MASADRAEEAARRKREAEAAARAEATKRERERQLQEQRNQERREAEAAERRRQEAARERQAAQQRAENEARLAAQRKQEADLQRVREAEAAKERARQEEIRLAGLRVAAAKPVAAPTAPVTAPIGGTADMREAAARAALQNITIGEAKKEIEKDVRAQNAITGAAGGAPTGMTADRAELQQIMDIYGVNAGEATKIRNTMTDLGRVNAGTTPMYKPEEKVAQIPTPRVGSSGPGSPAAGWQPSGPVSSVTGTPLFPGLEGVDASRVTTPGDQTPDTTGSEAEDTAVTPTPRPVVPTPRPVVPTPQPAVAPVAAPVQQPVVAPQQAALSAMTTEGGSSRTGLRLTPTARGRAEVKSTTPFMRQPQAERPGRALFASSRRYTPSYWANEVRR